LALSQSHIIFSTMHS